MRSFFAGLGFGVIAGLLLAPKRGESMRADLRDRARRIFAPVSGTRARQSETISGRKKTPASTTAANQSKKDSAAEILNSASRDALIAVHGIGPVLAERI